MARQFDKIIAETGVTIDIDEEGLVQIFSVIRMLLTVPKQLFPILYVKQRLAGSILYQLCVLKVRCLCPLFNKTDALIHISGVSFGKRTERVEDVVKVGDTVTVKIIKIDEKGRIDASIKTLLPKPEKIEDGKMKGEHRHRRRSHH